MKKKVAIIGHGYVGKQMEVMFSRAFNVIVYDPRYKNGSTEPYHENVTLYGDRNLVQGADLAVICVPTPMAQDGSCDTSIVQEVCSWIDAPLVCIKSTVPPGFTHKMNCKSDAKMSDGRPMFASGCANDEVSSRFHFSPEYAGEPINHVPPQYPDPRDSSKHDFCIVGGPQASKVLDFFAACMATSARYVATDSTTAELCKYMENAYFATKIMFCTEFAMIASKLGVDYKELRNLWTLDSRVDPDHTMVFPDALGFGGKCLPKDLSGIIVAAEAAGHVPQLLDAVRRMNWDLQDNGMKQAAE